MVNAIFLEFMNDKSPHVAIIGNFLLKFKKFKNKKKKNQFFDMLLTVASRQTFVYKLR